MDKIPARLPQIDVKMFSHLCDLPIDIPKCDVGILIDQDHSDVLIELVKKGQPFGVN